MQITFSTNNKKKRQFLIDHITPCVTITLFTMCTINSGPYLFRERFLWCKHCVPYLEQSIFSSGTHRTAQHLSIKRIVRSPLKNGKHIRERRDPVIVLNDIIRISWKEESCSHNTVRWFNFTRLLGKCLCMWVWSFFFSKKENKRQFLWCDPLINMCNKWLTAVWYLLFYRYRFYTFSHKVSASITLICVAHMCIMYLYNCLCRLHK